MDKLNRAGFVKKGDTLLMYRQMSGLTLKAFAGEMGMRPHHYEMLETGKWKVKFHQLKAALNVVRLLYSMAGAL